MLNAKALIDAPCGYIGDRGKMEYPSIICGEEGCDTCGWNPKEQARRLATGVMKPIKQRINMETEEPIVFTEPVERLVFPRKR